MIETDSWAGWDEVLSPRTGRAMHWDRHGQPVSLRKWVELTEHQNWKAFRRKKLVARTRVGTYVVSTVWLGLDHGFGLGPPLIFETMVFGGDIEDEFTTRYATEAGALRGHHMIRRAVRRLRHGANGPKPAPITVRRGRRRPRPRPRGGG